MDLGLRESPQAMPRSLRDDAWRLVVHAARRLPYLLIGASLLIGTPASAEAMPPQPGETTCQHGELMLSRDGMVGGRPFDLGTQQRVDRGQAFEHGRSAISLDRESMPDEASTEKGEGVRERGQQFVAHWSGFFVYLFTDSEWARVTKGEWWLFGLEFILAIALGSRR